MPAELIAGRLFFLTKLHLIKIKDHLVSKGYKVRYWRDDFDYIEIDADNVSYSLTQDGLAYGRASLEKPDEQVDKINHFIVNVLYKEILQMHLIDTIVVEKIISKRPEVVIIESGVSKKKAASYFSKLGREIDYSYSAKKPCRITKYYGHGLAVYDSPGKVKELYESQIVLSDFQNIVPLLFDEYDSLWKLITEVRNKSHLRLKDIPLMIDQLLEAERHVMHTMSHLNQLNSFLKERKRVVLINGHDKILKSLKLFDFDEMIHLNNYLNHQWDMAKDYINSTLTLIDSVYKENSQKEMGLLQVIFAVGTIASIVSLGAMPGAKFFFTDPQTSTEVAGDIIAFNIPDLLIWSMISIIIGIISFYIINKIYMGSKKLKIVNLLKNIDKGIKKDRVEK